jgi:mannosyl-oligosaccharide alpha-1,2-mannosidase
LTTLDAAGAAWTGAASLAEATTLAVETAFLARATGEDAPAAAAVAALRRVASMEGTTDGLAPIYLDAGGAAFVGSTITLGARGDSYYEYLLKGWLIGGKTEDWMREGYVRAMHGVRARLLRRTPPTRRHPAGLLYVGELVNGDFSPKMDHLVCFLPGLLALGAAHGVDTRRPGVGSDEADVAVAAALALTCAEMYRCVPAGLAPEIAHFHVEARPAVVPGAEGGGGAAGGGGDDFPKKHTPDVGCAAFDVAPADAHNLLRPEAVEAWFILWRVTRDPAYREWGWAAFRAWERWARVPWGGYANLDSVLSVPPPQRDKMESFFVAETLKYLLLLFEEEGAER